MPARLQYLDLPPKSSQYSTPWPTYQADEVGLHLVDFFGDGHMMWASGFPHADGTWPYSDEVVTRETAHLPAETRRKILRENAAALFDLAR